MPKKQLNIVHCPLCNDYSSKRLTNVEKHVALIHNTTLQCIWNALHNGPILCGCGCKQQTNWLGWNNGYANFIKGHNANIYSSYDEETANEISKKRSDKLRGRPGWALGLTKNSDQRIAKLAEAISNGRKQAFKEGNISSWSKGLTKETDERLSDISNKLKQQYKEGTKKQWHSGLSEKIDERIKLKNDNLRKRYKSRELVTWNKGKTKETDDRISKVWENRNPIKEYQNIRWTHEEIEKQLENNINISLEEIVNYRNEKTPALNVRCRGCNWIATVSLLFARNDICPICQPCSAGSAGQHEISDFITSLGYTIGRNVRGIIGRQELDIYVPAKLFAIEFNGLYYHNEAAGKDQHYHQLKTDRCAKVGIRLFHIFEDEWLNKREIISSMLRNALGCTLNKIHARKCKLVQLDNATKQKFFEENHLEGDTQSVVTFGLNYNNNIVAALSIRRPFHKTLSDNLEVGRYCTLINTCVVGGLSKLTVAAKTYAKQRGINKVLSYVDTRFSTGNGWKQSGWMFSRKTKERFWWTNSHKRFNRFKFKASSQRKMTELEVAAEANVVKIWGCCNLVFETLCDN